MSRTIMIYSPNKFVGEIWLPTLWSQSKSYYEKHGTNPKSWDWFPCYADIWADNQQRVQELILEARPDIFAVSLYVWNAAMALSMAKWTKQTFPDCLVISGGPQQDFKHDHMWFQKHPYLDCSLPGENYGELCFSELMDNFSEQINFNLVSDIRYPIGQDRMLGVSKKTLADKLSFDYDWSSFANQSQEIKKYIDYGRKHFTGCKIMAIVETTRGCPYGCTYCDWGGGINTKVIKKSLPVVQDDIDFLSSLDLKYLYVADANFGIFGARDVEIISMIARGREKACANFKIGYGGFAKTKNRLPFIRKIIEIDIEHQLSNQQEIKLSLQSLDDEVLKNIDRVNIPLDDQLAELGAVGKKNNVPFYVEIILGLPGMDLDKFYRELTILGDRKLSVQWYEWILLPETPAYNEAYRQKFGIHTIKKNRGWFFLESGAQREIVVSGNHFNHNNYFEMLLAAGMYNLLIQGGAYKHSLSHLQKDLGRFIQSFCQWYIGENDSLIQQWNNVISNEESLCELSIGEHRVSVLYYFVALSYLAPEKLLPFLEHFLYQHQVPKIVIWADRIMHTSMSNDERSCQKILQEFANYQNSGHILRKFSLKSILEMLY